VLKTLLVLFVPRLVKIVHVQLPHKRTEVVMLEVFREDVLCKWVRVLNNEAIALLVPKYRVRICHILKKIRLNRYTYIYNFVSFHQKVRHLAKVWIDLFLLKIGVLLKLHSLMGVWLMLLLLTAALTAHFYIISHDFPIDFAISGYNWQLRCLRWPLLNFGPQASARRHSRVSFKS